MTRYTVCVAYDVSYAATVTVEADTPEDACQRAIDKADDLEAWKSTDHASDAYIVEIAGTFDPGTGAQETVPLPIPDPYTRDGPPPTITFRGEQPPGSLEVTDGTVRFRFDRPGFAVTTEASDPPPPPGNKPLVTISRRPDGTPAVSVTGGKAHVRVTGWDDSA